MLLDLGGTRFCERWAVAGNFRPDPVLLVTVPDHFIWIFLFSSATLQALIGCRPPW